MSSFAVSSSESGEREIVEAFRFASAPARTTIEELGSGRADAQQRDVFGPVDQMVDEVEQIRVGPMEVLEHEHRRAPVRQLLEEAAPGVEALLARVVGLRRGRLDADERTQLRLDRAGLPVVSEQPRDLIVQLCPACAPSSVSRIPAWFLIISPSAQ